MATFFSRATSKINGSYWLRSGSFTFMNKIFTTLFGFGSFYILIRILSKADFGAWVLFLSITSLMQLIKHGFVRNPLIRFMAMSGKESSPDIQTASLFLNAVVALVEVLLLILSAFYLSKFWDSPQLKPLFLIYAATTLVLIPINHFDLIQQARMQFKGSFLSDFIKHAGLFMFIVMAYFMNFKIHLEHLALVHLGSIVLSGLVAFRYAKPYLEFTKKINWQWCKELYLYGAFTLGTNVSSMILKSTDSWMLGKLISPAAVTIFNPAIRVSNLVEVPLDTLTSILFPKLSERIANEGPQSAKYLYEKSVGTITAFMLPVIVFFIVFASPIVRFIAGPGFEETVPILQVTMIYGLIIPFNRFMGMTLDAIGEAKTNFRFVLRNAVMNVIANFFLIQHFGIIGAAYATLTTYVIMVTINQIYMHRKLNIRLINVFNHFLSSYGKIFSAGMKFLKGR